MQKYNWALTAALVRGECSIAEVAMAANIFLECAQITANVTEFQTRSSSASEYRRHFGDAMVEHLDAHSGDRYSCHYEGCEFQTARRDSLTRHIRTHEGTTVLQTIKIVT